MALTSGVKIADVKGADAPVGGGRGGSGRGGGRGGRGGGRGGSGRGGAPAAPAPTTPIATAKGPCSNTLVAFGHLWVATCGEQSLARIDQKTSKVIATLPVSVDDAMTGLAATADYFVEIMDLTPPAWPKKGSECGRACEPT